MTFLMATIAFGGTDKVTGGKVMRSEDGIRVEIGYLQGNKQILARVKNAGSSWDNQVLRLDVHGYDDKIDYKMQVKGRDYAAITVRRDFWEIWLPEKKDGVALTFDKKASPDFDPQTLLEGNAAKAPAAKPKP
jgi:hypothetical protein